ncbi:MAG: acetyl-CoA carboxylase biotin carboxyl carrier protein subunit [Chloroflexi bacterium]|nr:acetyl-CoA carboxylase biotin carboxyl carrier protein subunit [Chloroflexota bacterium]
MKRYTVVIGDTTHVVDLEALAPPDHFRVWVGGQVYELRLSEEASAEAHAAAAAPTPTHPAVARPSPAPHPDAGEAAPPLLRAPMPGVILEVNVQPGAQVQRGDQLLVLEAMKMKNLLRSPRHGVVDEIFVHAGQNVNFDDPLLRYRQG